jgi:Ala-tRNA(Pro) deacylase
MNPALVTAGNALSFLKEHDIDCECIEHPAIFSGADAEKLGLHFPGSDTKNLFLIEEKGTTLFLVTVPLYSRNSLKLLAPLLEVKRLTFGPENLMNEHLGITPGSVTPMALCNDNKKVVTCVVDAEIWNAEKVQIHPMRNTATIILKQGAFRKLLAVSNHEPLVIAVPRA